MQKILIRVYPSMRITRKELPPRPSLLNCLFQKANLVHRGIIHDVKTISVFQPSLGCVHGRVEEEIVVDVELHDRMTASEIPLGVVLDPFAVFVEHNGSEFWELGQEGGGIGAPQREGAQRHGVNSRDCGQFDVSQMEDAVLGDSREDLDKTAQVDGE